MISAAALAAGLLLAVPGDTGLSYAWVCGYLDGAPTIFGVLGLSAEAEERGQDLDPGSIADTVAERCPRHSELVETGLRLVG